eukprot:s1489_g10.t1
MGDEPIQKGISSFQNFDFASTEAENSHSIAKPLSSDILALHSKLDTILALLEKWEQKSLSLPLEFPFSSRQSEEIAGASDAPEIGHQILVPAMKKTLAPPSSTPAEMELAEDSSDGDRKKHRRLSAQNVLHRPGKRKEAKKGEPVGASVDFATWTEQVRQRCNFDAGAISRGLVRQGSKELTERSHVPSIQQMNGAFLQAVTMSKAERHAHFNEVEEHIDLEMERLGRKSSEEGDESKPIFPGLVPQDPNSPVRRTPSAGSQSQKVPTLVTLSNKSQAAILVGKSPETQVAIEAGQPDAGSKFLLSSVGRLFWLIGPLAVLASGGSIAVNHSNSVIAGADFRLGPAVAQLIYGLAAPSGVILLRMALKSDDMNLALDKMQLFVADFMVEWKKISGTEGRIYVAAWVLMMLCFATSSGMDMWHHGDSADDSLKTIQFLVNGAAVLTFGFASFLVTLVAYVQSHILLGLDRSLDCWCCSILNESDFALGVDSWNCLQALLKCIGRGIASSFLASQACGAIGLIYVLASAVTASFQLGLNPNVLILEGVHALPLLVFFLLNLRVCAHGANLTEKCRVIPAFVNQIPTEDALDDERQYLVRYVADSSAGFFVKEVKLTREMFLKNFVAVGGLMTGAVGVLSRIY